jgi:hypothetical protein
LSLPAFATISVTILVSIATLSPPSFENRHPIVITIVVVIIIATVVTTVITVATSPPSSPL